MSTTEKINETPVTGEIEQVERIKHPQHSKVLLEHDAIAQEIIGGTVADMPRGYYLRPAFVGTFTV